MMTWDLQAKPIPLLILILLMTLGGCDSWTWREFTSPAGRFSVTLPGTPIEQVHKVNTPLGGIDLHLFSVEHDGLQYMIAYNDYPVAMIAAGAPEQILDGARNGIVANVRGRLLSETKVSQQGYPGRELQVKVPDGDQTMYTRVYLVKDRLYQAGVLSRDSSDVRPKVDRFLRSFNLLDKAAAPPKKT